MADSKGHSQSDTDEFPSDLISNDDMNRSPTEESPTPSMKGRIIGDYQVEGVLGHGGMGTVYAAIHRLIGKRAAIKILNENTLHTKNAVKQFIEEARTVNQISHPYIVDIYSCGQLDSGQTYLVMEWLDGKTLGWHLKNGPFAMTEAVEYAKQICQALIATHDRSIVHRDLKPENIFLVSGPDNIKTIRILDFGISTKSASNQYNEIDITNNDLPIGTPAYVSPEQARGRDVDKSSDVYSLGCIFYEIFTGQKTFKAESAIEIVSKHLYETPAPPHKVNPALPKPLSKLIESMLNKEPDERPVIQDVLTRLASSTESLSTLVVFTETKEEYRLLKKAISLGFCGVVCAASAVYALNRSTPNKVIASKQTTHSEPVKTEKKSIVKTNRQNKSTTPSIFDRHSPPPNKTQSQPLDELNPQKEFATETLQEDSSKQKGHHATFIVSPKNAVVSLDGVLLKNQSGQVSVQTQPGATQMLTVSKAGYLSMVFPLDANLGTEPHNISLKKIQTPQTNLKSSRDSAEPNLPLSDLKKY